MFKHAFYDLLRGITGERFFLQTPFHQVEIWRGLKSVAKDHQCFHIILLKKIPK